MQPDTVSSSTSNSMGSRPVLRILMLHGYTQSGPLFRAKTRALEKQLQKAFPAPQHGVGVEFIYPTGPIEIPPASIPGFTSSDSSTDVANIEAYGWWRRKGDGQQASIVYEGMDTGLSRVAETLKMSGPFDGVIGFSQGGALAAIVASLLESGRVEAFREQEKQGGIPYPESFLEKDNAAEIEKLIHEPLKFAVIYSGFLARNDTLYSGFYNPKIQTPTLHFLGTMDTVVEESRSLSLVNACQGMKGHSAGQIVYHPGGHFVPSSQAQPLAALIGFIKDAISWDKQSCHGSVASKGPNVETGKGVEDMDMPF